MSLAASRRRTGWGYSSFSSDGAAALRLGGQRGGRQHLERRVPVQAEAVGQGQVSRPGWARTPKRAALATSLAADPDPRGPVRQTGPRSSRTGRHRRTSSGGPPANTVSRPARTASTLPMTGASSSPAPGGRAADSRRYASGATVDVCTSTSSVPASPASTPSSPSVTSRSACSSEVATRTTSLHRATARGVAAAVPPAAVNRPRASADRFQPVTWCPRRSSRTAMAWPMVPRPITPTRVRRAPRRRN